LLISQISQAQSPRKVLVEEFTGETCGPCASQNPAFDAKLNANSSAIPLKYQNNIPTTGPNLYTYNTVDIGNRTSYYANNYSPHAFVDGNVWNDVAGNFTNTILNNRAAVTSPFTITVTHSFSADHTIIYTHSVIRATQAYTGTTLKARVAVTERDIYGYTAPNGESHFEWTMRKMLPNGNGTALPSTWNVGDSAVVDLQWTIVDNPNVFLPYWPVLQAVTFVQDDATKEVLQAGVSESAAQVPFGAVTALSSGLACVNPLTPSVTLKNYGGIPLTSATIEYGIEGQTMQQYNWSGSLAAGATTPLSLGNVTIPSGGNQYFVAKLVSVNGNPDFYNRNFNFRKPVSLTSTPSQSLSQGFTSTTFPPADWMVNSTGASATWARNSVGGFGQTPGGSAKMDFYSIPSGVIGELLPVTPVDLSTATNPFISFSVAYCQYSTQNDRLQVLASTDCGATWTSLYNKAGATLATKAAQTAVFTPTATQWRSDTVSLANFIGQSSVLIDFKATSDYGNNLYVDDINLSGVTAVHNLEGVTSFNVYPNPANEFVKVSATFEKAMPVTIELADITGRIAYTNNLGVVSNLNETIEVKNLASGIYTLAIRSGNSVNYQKISIQ
jgi:hypothetical protein